MNTWIAISESAFTFKVILPFRVEHFCRRWTVKCPPPKRLQISFPKHSLESEKAIENIDKSDEKGEDLKTKIEYFLPPVDELSPMQQMLTRRDKQHSALITPKYAT